MARKRTPYSPPTTWDGGASGPANRERQRLELATDIDPETGRETPNPNNVRRYRRDTWVQTYARQGHLTPRQEAAAITLRMAAEGMRERDPLAAIGEVKMPSSGGVAEARIDARRYFRDLWARVPLSSRPVIERVVLGDQPLWDHGRVARERHLRLLRDGLESVFGAV